MPLLTRSGRAIGLFGTSRERELLSRTAELAQQEKGPEQPSVRDELTGLLDRRGFLTFGHPLFEQARETDTAISLLYVDVNGLGRINDECGHTWGDTALVDTAKLLRANTRQTDILARLGDDEFCILVVGERAVGERVSKRIWAAQGKEGRGDNRPFKLSLKSVGLANQQLGDEGTCAARHSTHCDRRAYRGPTR